MTVRYDPDLHHRRSIRLKAFDYTSAGAYFITICTQDRACLFGDVADGQVRLNAAGRMVGAVWSELPGHYPGVEVDAFIVVPTHVHGIIVLVGAGPRACPDDAGPRACPDQADARRQTGQPQGVAPTIAPGPRACPNQVASPNAIGDRPPRPGQPRGVAPTMSLADVVHRFKTLTTKRYTAGVHQSQWPAFAGRLWQRNYFEHIVRDAADLDRIRQYIEDNPARWAEDPDNPNVGAAPRGRPSDTAPRDRSGDPTQ
jgi:putative transposase